MNENDRPEPTVTEPRTDWDDPALYPFEGMLPQCSYIVHWAHCRLDAGHDGRHSPGRLPSEAAQGTETRAAQPLEAIPGWMAEEEGGTYYRQEQVDALLVSQGIWIAEGTGPIEALPEGAQGAAPRSDHDLPGHKAHECRICGNWTEGAAPRAEGLPFAPVAVRDALHATFRPATPRGEPITEEWLDVFTESLTDELRKRGVGFARLSRPSAELRMAAAFDEFTRAIEERIMPPLVAFSEEMHVWWFEQLPWYRQWWHIVTGHRNPLPRPSIYAVLNALNRSRRVPESEEQA